MPVTWCSMAIPKSWPPERPNSNSRNWNTSSTWWPDADFPNAPNAARIRERCGVVAIVFPSGEGRKTKWHFAGVRALLGDKLDPAFGRDYIQIRQNQLKPNRLAFCDPENSERNRNL